MGRNLLDIQMIMETFINSSYYSWPLMVLLNVAFLIIAIPRRKKLQNSAPLLTFGIGALSQDIIALVGFWLMNENDSSQVQDIYYVCSYLSSLCFVMIDVLTSYAFFLSRFTKKNIRKKIITFRLLFIITAIGLIIFSAIIINRWAELPNYIGRYIVAACLFALIPPFYYINRLFTSHSEERLANDPAWWVTCGFIIVNATVIPFFLMATFLPDNIADNLQTINYLSFCTLFILFSKAFFCKTESEKGNAYTS